KMGQNESRANPPQHGLPPEQAAPVAPIGNPAVAQQEKVPVSAHPTTEKKKDPNKDENEREAVPVPASTIVTGKPVGVTQSTVPVIAKATTYKKKKEPKEKSEKESAPKRGNSAPKRGWKNKETIADSSIKKPIKKAIEPVAVPPLINDNHEEPVAVPPPITPNIHDGIVPDERARSSQSNESETSEKSMAKRGRHGSWEYVPAQTRTSRADYPKGGNKKERELAKLAMDVVDSQHDVTKKTEAWYIGTEFDPTKQISMYDRNKLNPRKTRVVESLRDASPPKQKRARAANPPNEKKKSGKTKGITKRVETKGKKDIEGGGGDTSVDGGVTPLGLSMSRESGSIDLSLSFSSNYSEELGTPSYLLEEDMESMARRNQSVLSEIDQSMGVDNDVIRVVISPSTYSFPSIDNSIPIEFPENFLDDSGEMEETHVAVSPSNATLKRQLDDKLAQLEVSYNESGVQYHPRLLSVRVKSSMEEFVKKMESDGVSLVPILRSSTDSNRHICLVYDDAVKADAILRSGKITVGQNIMNVEQPGSFLVHIDDKGADDLDSMRTHLESTIGPIQHIEKHRFGMIVVMSSIDKATRFLNSNKFGTLTFGSLKDEEGEKDKRVNWPIADEEWARQLGLGRV
ncbi:hypothetical protein PENTCL1PPCAC_22246, partial [Pristionchus entomophagus]